MINIFENGSITTEILDEIISSKKQYDKCCYEYGIELKKYLEVIKKYHEENVMLSKEITLLEKNDLETSQEVFCYQFMDIKRRIHNLCLANIVLSEIEGKIDSLREKRRQYHKKCIDIYNYYGITDTHKINELVDNLTFFYVSYSFYEFNRVIASKEKYEEELRNILKRCFEITGDLSFIEAGEQESIEEIKQKNPTMNNSIKLISLIIKIKQTYEEKFMKLEELLNDSANIETKIEKLENLLDNNENLLKDKNKSIIIKLFNKSEIEELKGVILNLNFSLNVENNLFLLVKNRLKEKTKETLGFYNIYNSMCEMIDYLIEDLQEDELRKLILDLKIVIPKTEDIYFNEELEMKKRLKEFLLNRVDLTEYCKDNKLDIEDSNFIKTKRYIATLS